MIIKLCKRCKIEKSITEFDRHAQMSDGFLNKCKNCVRSYQRDWSKTHKRLSTEKDRERVKKWVSENMERYSKNTGEWAKRNLDKRRAYSSKYRALKRGNKHEPYDCAQIIEEEHSICYICLAYIDNPQLDHVIPISKGGSDSRDNLRVACGECNRKKSDKIYAY